jgi:hypothetical protein
VKNLSDEKRLEEIKKAFENTIFRLGRSNGKTQFSNDVRWLFEQTEKAIQYKNALENISNILEGQNVTPLVESLAYELSHSGIYDKY